MPRRDLVFLFLLALAFDFILTASIKEPGYVDDAYYFGGALRLVRGDGFTEPYLWNYLGNPSAIPQPSHLYWMPLTSLVSAGAMALFGQSFHVARLPFVLLGSLLPLVSYAVAWYGTGLRRHAICAALLTIFCGYYAVYWGTTDSFGLYGLIGGLTLLGIGRVNETEDWRWVLSSGIGAGLAHLTRADGILLLAVAVGQIAMSRSPFKPQHLALTLLGYLLVMLPWFIRNTLVVGNPMGGGAASLWLIEYNDLFTYPSNVNLARYLAAGWPTILTAKWDALFINLQHIIAEQGLIFFWPFIAIGLWQQCTGYRHVLLYAALLYFAMTFAFTFAGPRGGLFHSGVALLPFYFSAGMVGLDATIDWVAVRLKHWQPEKAKVNFSGLTVAMAAGITLFTGIRLVTGWGGAGDSFRQITADIPGEAVVMSNNAPGIWVATGHSGIPWVNGGVPDLLAAADHYGARYVLLDPNVLPGLITLYQSERGERLTLIKQFENLKLFEIAQ